LCIPSPRCFGRGRNSLNKDKEGCLGNETEIVVAKRSIDLDVNFGEYYGDCLGGK
jgi:hypothetical protein